MQVIASSDAFEALVSRVPLLVLKIGASWCGPCRAVAPQFEEWAQSGPPGVTFACLEIDDDTDLTSVWQDTCGVTTIPAFAIFKDGALTDLFAGSNLETVRTAVAERAPKQEE